MPTLIVIKGPAGVGKSTICKELLSKLDDYEFIDLEELKTKFGHMDRAERKAQAHSIYYPKIRKLLISKKNILLQESFIKDLRKECDVELRTKDYNIISIFLKASLEETKKRNSKRKRPLDDKYLERSYRYLGIPEKGDVIIDVEKNSIEQTVAKTLLILEEQNQTKV